MLWIEHGTGLWPLLGRLLRVAKCPMLGLVRRVWLTAISPERTDGHATDVDCAMERKKRVRRRRFRVLLVAYGKKGGTSGYKHRVCAMAEELVTHGLDVTLLYFTRIASGRREGIPRSRDRLRVISIPLLPIARARVLSVLSQFLARAVIWSLTRARRFDAVQAEAAIAAVFARNAKVRHFVVDFHGDTVAEQELLGSPHWKVEQMRLADQIALARANAFLAASEPLRRLMNTRRPGCDLPSAAAPCGVDLQRFVDALSWRDPTRRRLNIENRLVCCYMGGLDSWQCVAETVDLVARLRRILPRLFFLLLTPDPTTHLSGQLAEIGEPTKDYEILALRRDEIPQVLPAVDIGFLLRRKSPVNAVSSPTKCGEYLAAGVPVVTTVHAGDAATVIPEGRCGCLLPDVTLSNSNFRDVTEFVQDVELNRGEWSSRCRLAATKFHNWEVSRDAIHGIYRCVCPRQPS